MTDDHHDDLKSLHTALVDSRNGYEEALEDAEGKGLTPLFREMIGLRSKHADEIRTVLGKLGAAVNDEGSFMSTVHRTVISVRSAITGLGPTILPALIDGEERILKYYDDAIESSSGTAAHGLLASQRATVARKIADMRHHAAAAE